MNELNENSGKQIIEIDLETRELLLEIENIFKSENKEYDECVIVKSLIRVLYLFLYNGGMPR